MPEHTPLCKDTRCGEVLDALLAGQEEVSSSIKVIKTGLDDNTVMIRKIERILVGEKMGDEQVAVGLVEKVNSLEFGKKKFLALFAVGGGGLGASLAEFMRNILSGGN